MLLVHGPLLRTTDPLCIYFYFSPHFQALFCFSSPISQPPFLPQHHSFWTFPRAFLCSASPGAKAWTPSLAAHRDSNSCSDPDAQTRGADVTSLWPGLSVKWQDNLVPFPHYTDDETETQRWKAMVRTAQPAGLESSSFNSQPSRPCSCAWPDM